MYVVLRKFPEDKEWNICGVFNNDASADEQVAKEGKTGRVAMKLGAHSVWIAENGNHSWN